MSLAEVIITTTFALFVAAGLMSVHGALRRALAAKARPEREPDVFDVFDVLAGGEHWQDDPETEYVDAAREREQR